MHPCVGGGYSQEPSSSVAVRSKFKASGSVQPDITSRVPPQLPCSKLSSPAVENSFKLLIVIRNSSFRGSYPHGT